MPFAFHDLPASAFPFVIEFLRTDDGTVADRIEVTGPGAIAIPALAAHLGVPVAIRLTFADGAVETYDPTVPDD